MIKYHYLDLSLRREIPSTGIIILWEFSDGENYNQPLSRHWLAAVKLITHKQRVILLVENFLSVDFTGSYVQA